MTNHQSDAELHMERLVGIAMDCDAAAMAELSVYDLECVLHARMEMAGLMLLIGLLLAAKLRPRTR